MWFSQGGRSHILFILVSIVLNTGTTLKECSKNYFTNEEINTWIYFKSGSIFFLLEPDHHYYHLKFLEIFKNLKAFKICKNNTSATFKFKIIFILHSVISYILNVYCIQVNRLMLKKLEVWIRVQVAHLYSQISTEMFICYKRQEKFIFKLETREIPSTKQKLIEVSTINIIDQRKSK